MLFAYGCRLAIHETAIEGGECRGSRLAKTWVLACPYLCRPWVVHTAGIIPHPIPCLRAHTIQLVTKRDLSGVMMRVCKYCRREKRIHKGQKSCMCEERKEQRRLIAEIMGVKHEHGSVHHHLGGANLGARVS